MKKDMYAIIENGGKQFRVAPGAKLDIDFMDLGAGKEIELDKVLFIADGDEKIVGNPFVEDAKVKATCLDEGQGKKIIVFKYKNKVRYRNKRGHRQLFTRITIDEIIKPGGKTVSKPKKEKVTTGGKA
jgi:large subunit ribosomal protein L21